MTKFTKEQLAEYAKDCIEYAEKFQDIEIAQQEKVLFEIALAVLTAKTFMYGIADPDGVPHFDEECVGSDAGILQDEVDCLNDEACCGDGPRGVESDEYRVVALYRLPEIE